MDHDKSIPRPVIVAGLSNSQAPHGPESPRNLQHEADPGSESALGLPYDLIEPILSFLDDRADWHACCLVSKSFHEAATPLLYRTLDSRIVKMDGRNLQGNSMESRPNDTSPTRVSDNSDSNRNDSQVNIILYHPATTLLSNPHLAKHVRHVTETGAVHRVQAFFNLKHSTITNDALNALALCTHLSSFTWIDDTMYGPGIGARVLDANEGGRETVVQSSIPGTFLPRFIDFIREKASSDTGMPLRHLTLRTHSDLGSSIWASLGALSGLTRISIWSMDGPPRVLQGGWSKILGPTLQELELGRCAGVPPTILETVISHLPHLRSLRLKGVPSANILIFLTYLPDLENLDVEYLPSQTRLPARDVLRLEMATMPKLKTLTVRTNSRTDGVKMYDWIRQLARREGLEAFKLHAFSVTLPSTASYPSARPPLSSFRSSPSSPGAYSPYAFASLASTKAINYTYIPSADSFRNTLSFRDLGQTLIPRAFILDLARIHSSSLRQFEAAEADVMMMGDVECVCVSFPMLEVLECAVGVEGVPSIHHAIRSARHLSTLKLNIQWLPSLEDSPASRSPQARPTIPSEDDSDSDSEFDSDVEAFPDSEEEEEDISGYSRTKNYGGVSIVNSTSKEDGYGFSMEGPVNDMDVSSSSGSMNHSSYSGGNDTNGISRFTAADARSLMLRFEDSVLRTIGVGGVVYKGKWMISSLPPSSSSTLKDPAPSSPSDPTLEFVVVSNIEDQ
ncbi:hypothetical protein D9757_006457 [Collybiopsis confluens]|uniref:F-box domain-containing protein n=1 Tax=Collybiopsis confluens TaxID=2823264 RepID=A0A8H5HJR8_9AGAR|nr:hypothetical protein D9757_006457 [Collybiopsis confluens]